MQAGPPAEPAVEVEHVSKRFELGEIASLQLTMQHLAARVLRRRSARPPFVAVDDVSFSVARGECFTVMGTNGSGKSTLVKLLGGIMVPDAGRITTRGRVLPLLSVASALALDLTGRENVRLFGTILGLEPEEIRAALPWIVDFAELDREHVETPIKRYSEGMRARLAFATAMAFPADLYLLDEVLVTADDEFKTACAGEIERLVREGRTIIFISHELALVQAVSDRGMWLHQGRVRRIGPIDDVARRYEESLGAGG